MSMGIQEDTFHTVPSLDVLICRLQLMVRMATKSVILHVAGNPWVFEYSQLSPDRRLYNLDKVRWSQPCQISCLSVTKLPFRQTPL